ncbi:unnamed protein product, partial [Mesorhabditis spiculigera]
MKLASVQRQLAKAARTTIAKMPKPRPSYVHGASDIPLLHDTMATVFQAVEQVPSEEFAHFRHQQIRRTTSAPTTHDVRQLARGFIRLGLQPGDRHAAALAGLIQVNVNPAYQIEELKYALNKVGVRALVTPRSFRKSDYYGTLDKLVPGLSSQPEGQGAVRTTELPQLEHIIIINEAKPLP